MLVGSCLCGSVEFEITGDLPDFYQCHCSLCRRLSASASDTATFLNKEQFRWRKGESNIRQFALPSGYRSDFCSTCGSTVPHAMGNQTQVWVPGGLLPGDVSSRVTYHLYVGSKAHWDEIGDSGTQHPEMPDMDTLNDILQRKS
jgi:hypothetical protein